MNKAFAKAIAATKIVNIIHTTIDIWKSKKSFSEHDDTSNVMIIISHKKYHTKGITQKV